MVSLSRRSGKSNSRTVSRYTALFLALGFGCLGYLLGIQSSWVSAPGFVLQDDSSTAATASNSGTFQLAQQESMGFFLDVSQEDWERMKQRVRDVQPNTCHVCRGGLNTNAWFQNNYEPDFTCRHERRIGRLGDGGKWTCDPHLISQSKQCLVYSIGSNGEFSFEEAVKRDIGQHCEIHTFDMANFTEKANEAGAVFHQWGIGPKEGRDRRGRYYKTLLQTVQELGHEGRVVDIFKIDCDGCEWTSYESWFSSGIQSRQVLLELHSGRDNQMPHPQSYDLFKTMYKQGYVIFHKEPNIHYWRFGGAVEYGFLQLNETFFKDMGIQ